MSEPETRPESTNDPASDSGDALPPIDPQATTTCTTCHAEVKTVNIGKHFNWHIDVGHHTDAAQREVPEREERADDDS